MHDSQPTPPPPLQNPTRSKTPFRNGLPGKQQFRRPSKRSRECGARSKQAKTSHGDQDVRSDHQKNDPGRPFPVDNEHADGGGQDDQSHEEENENGESDDGIGRHFSRGLMIS